MRSIRNIAFTLFAAWLTVAATGCAPMSELERDYRAFQRAFYKAEFEDFRASCMAGGRLVIQNTSGLRVDGTPHRSDLIYCVRSDSAIRFIPSDPGEYVVAHAAAQQTR